MHISKKFTWIKSVALVISIAVGAGIAHYFYTHAERGPIYNYDDARDRQQVHEIFRKDWYWLSNRDYNTKNIDHVLKTHSPNEYEPRYRGKMKIKVLREEDKVLGFITYYMLNFYEGKILFLAIEEGHRGKRYGEKLLDYAVKDLAKQGAQVVRLVTRTNNQPAQKLYKRFGFVETMREDDEGFVHFAIQVS